MAGRGPAPLAQRQRDRDTRRRASAVVQLVADGELRGPDFPVAIVPEPHPATVEWWDTWRRAPQAQLFLPTDWETLKRAARLQDAVMTSPKVSAAALSELRLVEERLGATYADRLRVRIRVDTEPELAPVTELRPNDIAARLAASRAAAERDEEHDPAPF